MDLEHRVAHQLYHLRLIESALHGRARWSIRGEGYEVPATVALAGERVIISAQLPEAISGVVALVRDGEPVLYKEMEPSSHTELHWLLGLGEPVST